MDFFKKDWILNYAVPFLISLLGLGLVFVLYFGLFFTTPVSLFLHNLENQVHDRMLRWSTNKPYSSDLHFVAINRPSYEPEVGPGGIISEQEVEQSESLQMMLENFPWSRAVWANAIERLIEDGGADVVVLDLLLESSSQGDTQLRRVMKEHSEDVVTGSRIDRQDFGEATIEQFKVSSETVLGPDPKSEAFLQQPEGRLGHVNVFPSPRDGIVRTITYQYEWHNQKLIPSLSARAIQKADNKTFDLPEKPYTKRIRFSGPPSTYPPRPIYELFVDSLWKANYSGEGSVEGDIVVIGPFGNWQQDYKQTPVADDLMPGPELHLNAIAALNQKAFLRTLGDWPGLYLTLVFGLIATVIFLSLDSTYVKLSLFLLVGLAYIGAGFGIFESRDLFIPVVFPVVTYTGNGLMIFGYQYFRERREKQRIRGTLDRYISSDVASEILDNREDYMGALGGERKDVTVVFSDIRSFTPISEELSPHRLVNQLNEFLTPMTEIIQERKGRLDKFIGDAIMAVWGDLFDRLSPDEEVEQAVTAALEMLDRTDELNEKWESEGYPAFNIGIGINRGRSVFGNLGAESRMEMTVIGDAVNQAARFEGLTKTYGIELIIGKQVHELLPESILSVRLDKVRVKGKTDATEIFGVLGKRDDVDPDVLEDFQRFQDARELYAEGQFETAHERFGDLETSDVFDTLAQYYQERLDELMSDPPEDWNGIWVMKSK